MKNKFSVCQLLIAALLLLGCSAIAQRTFDTSKLYFATNGGSFTNYYWSSDLRAYTNNANRGSMGSNTSTHRWEYRVNGLLVATNNFAINAWRGTNGASVYTSYWATAGSPTTTPPQISTNQASGNTNPPPSSIPTTVSVWAGTNADPNGYYTGGLGSIYNQFDTSTNFLRQWVKQSGLGRTNWIIVTNATSQVATISNLNGFQITSPVGATLVPEFTKKPFIIVTIGASQGSGIKTYTNQTWIDAGTNNLPNGSVGSPFWPWPEQLAMQLTNATRFVYTNLNGSAVQSSPVRGILKYTGGGTGLYYHWQIISDVFNPTTPNGIYMTNNFAQPNGGTNVLVILDSIDNDCNTNQSHMGYTEAAVLAQVKNYYTTNINILRAWGTNVFILAKTTYDSSDWGMNTTNGVNQGNFHAIRNSIRNQINDWVRTNLSQSVDWVFDEAIENNPGEHPKEFTVDGVVHGNLKWHQREGSLLFKKLLEPRFQMLPAGREDVVARSVVLQPNGTLLLQQHGTSTNLPALSGAQVPSMWVVAISNTPTGAKYFGDGSALTGVSQTSGIRARLASDFVVSSLSSFTNVPLSVTLTNTGTWRIYAEVTMSAGASSTLSVQITNSIPINNPIGELKYAYAANAAIWANNGWPSGSGSMFPSSEIGGFPSYGQNYRYEFNYFVDTTNLTTLTLIGKIHDGTSACTVKAGSSIVAQWIGL